MIITVIIKLENNSEKGNQNFYVKNDRQYSMRWKWMFKMKIVKSKTGLSCVCMYLMSTSVRPCVLTRGF